MFATLQSVGAVGLSAGAQAAIGATGAAVTGGVAYASSKMNGKNDEDKENNEAEENDEDEETKQDINTDNYKTWSTEELVKWIVSLDPEIYIISSPAFISDHVFILY